MGHISDPDIKKIIEDFGQNTRFLKIFGSYPSADLKVWQ
jgi:prephenate dehydratase